MPFSSYMRTPFSAHVRMLLSSHTEGRRIVAARHAIGTCVEGWSAYPGEPGEMTVWRPD